MFGGFGAQGGYPPPQQQGYNPGFMRNGPPPAKKVKNNPVITRYAPPPGYQGPAQHQAPYQQQGWPHQPQPYNYGQQHYPSYPQQAYGQHQSHPHNQWHAYGQQQQQQQNGYPPGYYTQQQAQAWSPPTPNNPNSAPATHPANWQIPPAAAPYFAPPQSYPPGDLCSSNKRRHQSEPFVGANAVPAGAVADGNGEPLPPQSPRCEPDGNVEDGFDGECYFLRHPEDIDPSLSIGELVWCPAQPTTLALPSTWKESQLELIAPRKDPPKGETSVSEYFYLDKREETLISVRLKNEWWDIKDDIIFKELPECPKNLMPMSEMLAKYRDRPDPKWLQRAVSETPEPAVTSVAIAGAPDRAEMNGDAPSSEDGDILGNLEQALRHTSTSKHSRHSRANSITSITSNHSTKLKPLVPVRDRAQDDILATLGVTGSPKMVYETPGPAFGPPPSGPREGSVSREHSRRSSVASNSSATRVPPPPPPGQPRYHARRPSNHNTGQRPCGQSYHNGYNSYNGSRRGSDASHHSSRPGSSGSRPGSSGSRHTASGSDFAGGADEERTPRPKYQRTDSRKRGYEDYRNAGRDEDATPRQQRYKQPRVDDASARRW